MLADIITFIKSRTGMTDRAAILLEINNAWKEIWIADDLPNSVFEVVVKPTDTTSALITLPHYVGWIKAVKALASKQRITLNDPRPHYHDESYWQDHFTYRILGVTPLIKTITNATTLTVSLFEAEETNVVVTLIGPTDTAASSRERITFLPGETTKETTLRFTDLKSAVKDVITLSNVSIVNSANEEIGYIPNDAYEARNTILQLRDSCNCLCSTCECFEVLYKILPPVLYFDEQTVAYENVIQMKALEYITMPKDGQENKTAMYAMKAAGLLRASNSNQNTEEQVIDIATSHYHKVYHGHL